MFGLQTDAIKHEITLAPHVPADWTTFAIRNVRCGESTVDFEYRKMPDRIVLDMKRTGSEECQVEFSPALSKRALAVNAEFNGKPVPPHLQMHIGDQHVSARVPLAQGSNRLIINSKNDFGVALASELPPLGSASRALRVVNESWNATRDHLTLELSGLAGKEYALGVWNPEQVTSVKGGEITRPGKLRVQMPDGPEGNYVRLTVEIRFDRH